MAHPGHTISTDQAKNLLDKLWIEVSESFPSHAPKSKIPIEIREAIARSVSSKTKTYRYVLPTHLLAKCVDVEVDCRSVQAGSNLPGAFDARSLCHKVVVPFDRSNHNVLGGSAEPYLNNPLRIPAVIRGERSAQKDKAGFDDLCAVLEYAQNNPKMVSQLILETLFAIRQRMESMSVTYSVPNRISHLQALAAIDRFVSDATGGL